MLRRTFIHCPGIGPHRERELWRGGYPDWDAFLDRHPPGRWRDLIVSRLNLERVAQDLPRRETWRLYPDFSTRTGYLDIETDGVSPTITCIGLYDGTAVQAFVRGEDLGRFPAAVERFELLVTYNGSCFDLPILQATFPRVDFRRVLHVDLRFPLHRLGCRGGLKAAERSAGIVRDQAIQGADGYTAVLLWRAHRSGHPRALETLLRYCLEDVVNLKPLIVHAYNGLVADLPLAVPRLSAPAVPVIPYRADADLVRDLVRQAAGSRG